MIASLYVLFDLLLTPLQLDHDLLVPLLDGVSVVTLSIAKRLETLSAFIFELRPRCIAVLVDPAKSNSLRPFLLFMFPDFLIGNLNLDGLMARESVTAAHVSLAGRVPDRLHEIRVTSPSDFDLLIDSLELVCDFLALLRCQPAH